MTEFKVGDRVVMAGKPPLLARLERLIPKGETFEGQWQAVCDDGDSAIFHEHQIELIANQPSPEITLRDRFAMNAMIGLMAHPSYTFQSKEDGSIDSTAIAEDAYQIAWSMMAEREKAK